MYVFIIIYVCFVQVQLTALAIDILNIQFERFLICIHIGTICSFYYTPYYYDKIPDKGSLRKEEFILVTVRGTVHHGRKGKVARIEGRWLLHPQSGSRERDGSCCLAPFLLFIQSGIPTPLNCASTFRMGLLPSSFGNTLIAYLDCVSVVILNLINLTMKINHHIHHMFKLLTTLLTSKFFLILFLIEIHQIKVINDS